MSFDFFSGSTDRRRATRLLLLAIVVLTLPCYCLGFVLLAYAPADEGETTPAPTNPTLGGMTLMPLATATITPFGFTATPTRPGGPLLPTPGQIYLPTNTPFVWPTATLTFTPTSPPPVLPSLTSAPTITPSPTLAPTIPTSTPLPTATPLPTNTLVPTDTPVPTETPTDVPPPTDPPTLTPEPSPTQEQLDGGGSGSTDS